MSLIRDSNRVQRLALHLSQRDIDDEVVYDEGIDALEQAVDYLINFNMAGLHRVEEKMFVGWLRANLCDASLVGVYCENGKDVSNAFREVIDTVDKERIRSSKMGKELVRLLFVHFEYFFDNELICYICPSLYSFVV